MGAKKSIFETQDMNLSFVFKKSRENEYFTMNILFILKTVEGILRHY